MPNAEPAQARSEGRGATAQVLSEKGASRLRAAAILQGLGALLPLLAFLTLLGAKTSQGIPRALLYLCAPVGLFTAPFLYRRDRWAWMTSLALVPLYALGPWVDLSTLTSSLHGGEVALFGFAVMGVLGGLLLAVLLWLGREGVVPGPKPRSHGSRERGGQPSDG